MNTRDAIRKYQEIMRIGESMNVSGPNFRAAYDFHPLRESGYAVYEEVFLADSPGAMYGAWTVEYHAKLDYYEIQKNELGVRRVFVAPESRYKFRQDNAGYWHRKDMLS